MSVGFLWIIIMNKARRKTIEIVAASIENAISELEMCRDEEQNYYDNMPDSLRDSSKGEAADDCISNLDDAISSLEDALDSVNNSIEQ